MNFKNVTIWKVYLKRLGKITKTISRAGDVVEIRSGWFSNTRLETPR